MDTLIVFSHLRWTSVYQRPQHLTARFARRYRVLFVEEPSYDDGPARAELATPLRNLTVLTPRTPVHAGGFHDEQLPTLRRLIREAMAAIPTGRYGVLTYTPMALPLLQDLSPCVIAYDCMDELASFRHAPRQLAQRESALLRMANVVFTGGPSLYESRRDRHDNVRCFPSSVEAAHFARGRIAANAHPAIASVRGPRLGFYGVIDERFDSELIAAVAAARPDWSIFLVGPFAKIDRASLPDEANVHYLPKQDYAALPSLLAGWDICILPFARNDATRHVSPTKTLEYLAADKPVVSTPIADVQRLYGDVVRIAGDADAFVAACESLLDESLAERRARLDASRALVQRTSWDDTAREMISCIEHCAQQGLRSEAVVLLSATSEPQRLPAAVRPCECLVLGAGAAGLSAAYHYGEGATLIERESEVGGSCRSIEDNGFTFDRAGHAMVSADPDVQELHVRLLGDNVLWQERESWIYSGGRYTRHPLEASLERGAGAEKDLAIRYLRKLGSSPLAEIEAACARGRLALPDPDSGLDLPGSLEEGSLRFGYPLRGGFQALANGFLPLLKGTLELNADVREVRPTRRQVVLRDGRVFGYEVLVSTLPLPELIAAIGEEAPPEMHAAAARLRSVSLRCVNLGIGRPHLSEKHWIYYPEDTIFHRVFLQGNASPHCNAPGGFALTCEIACSPLKPLPAEGEALIARCFEDLVRVGLVSRSDPVWSAHEVDTPYAYALHDHSRKASVERLRAWLERNGILLAGRAGEWESYGSETAFLAGRDAARRAAAWIENQGRPVPPALSTGVRTAAASRA